jgi:hypothetical protein
MTPNIAEELARWLETATKGLPAAAAVQGRAQGPMLQPRPKICTHPLS